MVMNTYQGYHRTEQVVLVMWLRCDQLISVKLIIWETASLRDTAD